MRLKCIACDVLARPVYLCAAHSPQIVDVSLERFGLHLKPAELQATLQAHIDAAENEGLYDAVVLVYGLCGKATEGLHARQIPLVIPRAHDCITLFLGNRDRYAEEFQTCPGTYWYVQDYIQRGESEEVPLSIGGNAVADKDLVYLEYVEKYGKDNADYLLEVMGAWEEHYERAAYIDLGVGKGESVAEKARQDAKKNGWRFERLAGDLILIRRLLYGDWGEEDFLVLHPGQRVEMIGGEEVIRAKK
jgi:hypothetical protein